MVSFITKAPRSRRTLIFGSTMHVWSDLFFTLLVPLLPFIKEDMGLSFTEVGLLRSVFSGASAVLQVPAGFLTESVGEFWMLICGNIWVSAGLMAMAMAPAFLILVAASGIGGLGGGRAASARVQHGIPRLRRQGAGNGRRHGQLRG